VTRQEQSSGDDSVNIQAGHGITFNVGVSASEVRELALDVYRANFLELRGIAEDVARERAERITNDFIDALKTRNSDGLASIQDPDMQVAIYNAQKGYACSGDADLESALIDLLVDRAGQATRNLKTLVLNQAIECIPRLTAEQRKALAITFLVRHTSWPGPLTLAHFYGCLATNWAPFADIASIRPIDLQYTQAAGVGAGTPLGLQLEAVLWQTFCGFLFKGFTLDQAKPQIQGYGLDDRQIEGLLADRSVIVPCLRNSELWQFNAISIARVQELQKARGIIIVRPGNAGPLENICLQGQMAYKDMREDTVSHVPGISQLFENWESSGLNAFDLTAVGIAIGHSYWRQTTGSEAPLDIWL
jgi:hypothetical protein